MEEVPPGYVAVGRVGSPWGVQGVVRVVPLVDRRERLAPGRAIIVGGERRVIEGCRWQKGQAHLKLSGIDDQESAAALRDQLLAVPESELEALAEGEYYRFQLIGLEVRSTAGAALGRVTEVLDTGANDVYVVKGEEGEVLVPATDEVIKEIDLPAGRMVIEAVPGLIPEPRRKR